MTALNILLNGKKICTAGIHGDGVLAAHVIWARRKGVRRERLSLHVGGLHLKSGKQVVWHEALPLKARDNVLIEVAKSTHFDKPTLTKKRSAAAEKDARKKYVRRMAKQFGWKIIVPR